MLEKRQKRNRRHRRARVKISGTAKRPRLCVFRSRKHIYAQLIDDEKGRILASASDLELKKIKTQKKKSAFAKTSEEKTKKEKKQLAGKLGRAYELGKLIAEKARHKKKIEKVVFDRGGYTYHGRIKAVAEGAREGGLKF